MFKIGDKVKRVGDDIDNLEEGNFYTVEDVDSSGNVQIEESYDEDEYHYNSDGFELVKRHKKEKARLPDQALRIL